MLTTVVGLLLVGAIIMTLLNAAEKPVKLWIPVLLIEIAMAVQLGMAVK